MSACFLTLYTWPESFADPHSAKIQRNAVRSWLRLEPRPEILVFGDEPGVKEYCQEFGLRRVADRLEVIDGTVRIRDMAESAERQSDASFYCFINADIILTDSLLRALERISSLPHFLLGASPWNVDITEDLTFDPGWQETLEKQARVQNDLRSRAASDFFVYRKGYLSAAPSLIMGRPYVDNGLMWYARKRGDALVDGTPGIFTVHQNHDYRHFGDKANQKLMTPGALLNLKVLGARNRLYTWANATHHYTKAGLRPYRYGQICRWSTHPRSAPRAAKLLNFSVHGLASATASIWRGLGLVNPR